MYQVVKVCAKSTYSEFTNPDTNYGGAAGIKSGVDSAKSEEWKSYMEWDVSAEGIPAAAIVQSTSKIRIYLLSLNAVTNNAQWWRPDAAWNEVDPGGLTYNNAPGAAQPWDTGAAAAQATGWYTITGANLAVFFQDALDNRSGIVSFVYFANTADAFWVAQSDDADNPPELTIDYLLPHVQVSVIG